MHFSLQRIARKALSVEFRRHCRDGDALDFPLATCLPKTINLSSRKLLEAEGRPRGTIIQTAPDMTATEPKLSPTHDVSGVAMATNLALFSIAALAARSLWLATMPGVNGDETWYGLWVLRCLHEGVCVPRTPSGNLLNPFYMGLVALSQGLSGGPSILALRLPAVVSGLAFVAFGSWSLRRHFGPIPATVFALLAAGLPIDVAYARFGWDTAQMGLASMVALDLALSDRRKCCVLAWIAAVLVHPTAIFLLPVLCTLMLRDAMEPLDGPKKRAVYLAMAVAAPVAAAFIIPILGIGNGHPWHPRFWFGFLTAFIRLFSGGTVYDWLSGGRAPWFGELATAMTLAGGIGVLAWSARAAPFSRPAALLIGWGQSVLAFAVVAGPPALAPGFERYGLVLIGPTLLLVAVGIATAFGRQAIALGSLIGWLGLASCAAYYFLPMATAGGLVADPATVAAVDPKQQAAQTLAAWAGEKPRDVIADDWWVATPLAYFLYDRPTLRIIEVHPGETLPAADYAVTFVDSEAFRRLAATSKPSQMIVDTAGRPAVALWRLRG